MRQGQYMELQGEVIWDYITPHCDQVFVQPEVSGRTSVAMKQLDKISSESAPTDKASASNIMFPWSQRLSLKRQQHPDAIFGGNQPQMHARIFFTFYCFSLFSSLSVFPSNPLGYLVHSLFSEGTFGAKKNAAV